MKRLSKFILFSVTFLFAVVAIQSSTYAWFISNLFIIYYEYDDGGTAATTYRDLNAVYGKTYHIDSPVIDGYEPDMPYIEFIYTDVKAFTVKYHKVEQDEYELIINYLDEDGNVLADQYKESLPNGEEYNIESPYIYGYTPDINNVSGTLTENKTIDVVYTKNTYSLSIKYINWYGNEISDEYHAEYKYLDEYNVESPIIYGYTPNVSVVSGTITRDEIIYVSYGPNRYRLTIYYNNEDGNPISTTYTCSMDYGNNYYEPSPVIYGYTPDIECVQGLLDKDYIYTVTYYKNEYDLVIDYVDESGNKITESYNSTYKYNDTYEIETPNIAGYETDIENVSGTIYANTNIVVKYNVLSYTLTINYLDLCGNKLKESTVMALKNFEEYNITTEEIEGYYTDDCNVKGKVNGSDYTIDIKYHKCNTLHSGEEVAITITTFVANMGLFFAIVFDIIKKKTKK